jgi:hypothetical protein
MQGVSSQGAILLLMGAALIVYMVTYANSPKAGK